MKHLNIPSVSAAVAVLLSLGCVFMVSHRAAADENTAKSTSEVRTVPEIRSAVAQGQLLSLPRILELAQQQVAGEPVKIELERKHGRLEYEVKILADTGRVREVKLDAQTGAILKVEDD
ncbi:MAG: PepSY domain-containing protein [Proteobacteria bacterium]|nr:PepSY domain-containing protein [Pseudomonadota bacterium]